MAKRAEQARFSTSFIRTIFLQVIATLYTRSSILLRGETI